MCTNPRKLLINGEEVTVKCGKCLVCKRRKQMEWSIKLINEAKYHKTACFITLTFDNRILLDKQSRASKFGANASFIFNINNSKDYFTKFIKRLRKHYKDKAISYFHIGEYGEKTKRPHHHAIIYGIDFSEDRIEMERSKSGKTQYHSQTLYNLWACGRVSIQDLNPHNTAYICQYSLKKFKNNELNKQYKTIMSFSNRNKMSVRWARRNQNRTNIIKGYLTDDENKKYRIPRSYLENFKNSDKILYKETYRQYEENLMNKFENISDKEYLEKMKIKEEILEIRTSKTIRDFQNGVS